MEMPMIYLIAPVIAAWVIGMVTIICIYIETPPYVLVKSVEGAVVTMSDGQKFTFDPKLHHLKVGDRLILEDQKL